MSITDNLPEYFFIESHYGSGYYNNFGVAFNYLASQATQDDFINFIKNESEYKTNADLIISNMNYISYLFISPTHNNNNWAERDHNRQKHFISKQLLKEHYPKMYEMLLNKHQVIIAWCMGHHDESFCKKDVYCCDCIESRINHDLYHKLYYMNELKHRLTEEHHLTCVTDQTIKAHETVFWHTVPYLGVYDDDLAYYYEGVKEYLNSIFTKDIAEIYRRLCPLMRFDIFVDNCGSKYLDKQSDYLESIGKDVAHMIIDCFSESLDDPMYMYVLEQGTQHFEDIGYKDDDIIDEIVNHIMQMKYPEYKPEAK